MRGDLERAEPVPHGASRSHNGPPAAFIPLQK